MPKQKWEAQEFPKIEGDETEYIPIQHTKEIKI